MLGFFLKGYAMRVASLLASRCVGLLLIATLAALGSGCGSSSGGAASGKVRAACDHICYCLGGGASGSSSGEPCSVKCPEAAARWENSPSHTFQECGSSSQPACTDVPMPSASCLDCLTTASCADLSNGTPVCTAECPQY